MAEGSETLREPVRRLVFLVECRPIRDDTGSVVVETDLSVLGPNLTILGGMEKGEALVDDDYQDRPDFWSLASFDCVSSPSFSARSLPAVSSARRARTA